jgi:hypothetical protein
MKRYFDTEEEIEEALGSLTEAVCPHCGARALYRHNYIWRYGGKQYGLKGKRVFCDPDNTRGIGCGRTVTLWLSDTLQGRCLRAAELMRFIIGLLDGLAVCKAWSNAETGMTLRTGYRTYKRLENSQSVIRTDLFGLSPPPLEGEEKTPLSVTLKILKEAFSTNFVSAYQKTLQKVFP